MQQHRQWFLVGSQQNEELLPMWDSYAPADTGIAVSTSVAGLIATLAGASIRDDGFDLMRVQYCDQPHPIPVTVPGPFWPPICAKYKSRDFRHENEVRVVYSRSALPAQLDAIAAEQGWQDSVEELIEMSGLLRISGRLSTSASPNARLKAALLNLGRPATSAEIAAEAGATKQQAWARLGRIGSLTQVGSKWAPKESFGAG